MPAGLKELAAKVLAFRDQRDWRQYHNPKDVALSLLLEAAELLELTQWRNGAELERHMREHKDQVAEELSDVLYWVLLLAADQDIDLEAAFCAKLEQNAAKYPVSKAFGRHAKYTDL